MDIELSIMQHLEPSELKLDMEAYHVECNGVISFKRIEIEGWKREQNGIVVFARDGKTYPLHHLILIEKETLWEILK